MGLKSSMPDQSSENCVSLFEAGDVKIEVNIVKGIVLTINWIREILFRSDTFKAT